LKAAGAVILGKTNLHEAALGSTTDNAHWGWTHNPLRHGYTAGGSSGGSAAAVAAGLCDAALGSDTMGSVRVPAGHCGLVGFKPTFDAIPCEGVAPLCWALDHVGPITKTVADARAMFQALADPVEPAPAPQKPRIVKLAAFEVLPLEPDVAAAYAESLRRIEALWGPIETVDLPGFDPVTLRQAALLAIEADAAAIHADQFDLFSPKLRKMLDYGAKLSAPRLARALEQLRQARKAILVLLQRVDMIISPTTAMTAFPLNGPSPPGHSDFMGLAVFAGAPAISVPMPMAESELPAGLQLIAAPGRDLALLDWAEAVEGVLTER
jgi:Asp-tRNA(Asn)/Glu-tRNA(Gln) amidotransferase A subunit family amidase